MGDGGYRSFSRLIAANMAHAGALRIDHAMGLRRLFVVPDGMTGADGAYIDMPFDDLLGILAHESHRAECLVVGEDLGTVPDGFRDALSEADVLAYRVLWFERDGIGFKLPRNYPQKAAACVSTHDLATLHGWWQGADIVENLALGFVDAASAEAHHRNRSEEKARLIDLLFSERLISQRPDLDLPMADAVSVAIHALVASAPSMLAFAQADELTGETRAVNLPGTDRERANWRRKLTPAIETMFESPLAREIMTAMRR
jgi:glycogen operon protein